MKPWLQLTAGILIGLLAAGIILLVSRPPRGEPIQLPPAPTAAPWVVYVNGAVTHPGVFSLPANSRILNAIDSAGGLAESADPTSINMAALLKDGEQITVLEKGRVESRPLPSKTAELPEPDHLIDINLAAPQELVLLPGIGPQKAAQIVQYRQEHGLFQSIEQIQNVPGIGPVLYEQINRFICINQP